MAGMPGLERGLDVIEFVAAAREGVGFNAIAARLGVAHATAARILRVLRERGFVVKDTVSGRYGAGAKMTLSGLAVPVVERLRQGAELLLPGLVARTCNTVLLIHWTGTHMQCLAKCAHPDSIAMQPMGEIRTNLLDCPWGWLFYQSLDAASRRRCWQRGPREYSDITRSVVDVELKAFARNGYIGHVQPQMRRLAAPVTHAEGSLAGALVMGGTPFTIPDRAMPEFGGLLMESARRLSAALGGLAGTRHESAG